MASTKFVPDQLQMLEAADRVARAAHIWICHGNAIRLASNGRGAREDLVAGVIFGLCKALELDDRHALMSAYVYALLDGEVAEALIVARSMFRRRTGLRRNSEYQQGLQAANDLISLVEWPLSGVGETQRALPI